MKNKTKVLTTTVITSFGINCSAFATEAPLEQEFAHGDLEGKAANTVAKDASVGYQSEGGLAGSGLCCADCRDFEIN